MNKILFIIGLLIALINLITIALCEVFLKTNVRKFPSTNAINEREWLNKVKYEDHYIASFDKKFLHAISVKKITNNWVIIVHGYDSEALNMACYAEKFYDMGYNVLLIDQRGFGLSEGNETTMGNKEKKDLIKWIDYLNGNGAEKIILFGVSMGASTVMLTSDKIPSNVRVIIEDCGYTSVYDEFKYNLKRMFRLPEKPFMNIAKLYIGLKYGWNLSKNNSCKAILNRCKTPILFIHGSSDDFVPFYMHDELFECANCEKEKLVIYGAGHAESHIVNEKLYWKTIESFINKHI